MRIPDRLRNLLLLAVLLTVLGPVVEASADPVAIKATLILASNDPAPQDLRLDRVEYKLRRIFGFEYYRHYGEASSVVNPPGAAVLDLGHGYRLKVTVSGGGGGYRAKVNWLRGDESVLNTSVHMKRRTPVILGGISHGGGTLIVTLVAE